MLSAEVNGKDVLPEAEAKKRLVVIKGNTLILVEVGGKHPGIEAGSRSTRAETLGDRHQGRDGSGQGRNV